MKLQSKHIVVKVCFPHILGVNKAGYFIHPVVFSHCSDFLGILSILLLLLILTKVSIGGIFLVLFHILNVPLNLVFKGIKRVNVGLRFNCYTLTLVSFFHEKLHLADIVVEPGG